MGKKSLSRAEAELIKARDRAFTYRNTFENIIELVNCLNTVSQLYSQEDRLAEAISSRKESVFNVANLARLRPQDVLIQRFQFTGLIQLGELYLQIGDHKAAEHAFRDGLLKTRSVAARFPTDLDCQYDMFSALILLAEILDAQGDMQNAFDVYVDALGVARTYSKLKLPTRTRQQNLISFSLRRIGMLLRGAGELRGARGAFREAVSITKAEAAAYPHDLQCRYELAQDLTQLASILSDSGEYDGAVKEFELALTVLRATGNSSPAATDCDELAGTILLQLAEIHAAYDNRISARRTYRAAIGVAREMVKISDSSYDAMKFLAHCLDEAAYDILEDEAYGECAAILREVVILSRRLLPFEPDSEFMQHRFSNQLKNLMDCEFALSNEEAAYEAALERCDFDEHLVEANVDDYVAKWRLADGLIDLCRWLDDHEKIQELNIALGLMESLEEKGRLPSHQREKLDTVRLTFAEMKESRSFCNTRYQCQCRDAQQKVKDKGYPSGEKHSAQKLIYLFRKQLPARMYGN